MMVVLTVTHTKQCDVEWSLFLAIISPVPLSEWIRISLMSKMKTKSNHKAQKISVTHGAYAKLELPVSKLFLALSTFVHHLIDPEKDSRNPWPKPKSVLKRIWKISWYIPEPCPSWGRGSASPGSKCTYEHTPLCSQHDHTVLRYHLGDLQACSRCTRYTTGEVGAHGICRYIPRYRNRNCSLLQL